MPLLVVLLTVICASIFIVPAVVTIMMALVLRIVVEQRHIKAGLSPQYMILVMAFVHVAITSRRISLLVRIELLHAVSDIVAIASGKFSAFTALLVVQQTPLVVEVSASKRHMSSQDSP